MKPSPLPRLVLVLALPCAGFAAAWALARMRVPAPPPPAEPAPVVALEPRSAERRPLAPEPRSASPAPAAAARPARDEWVELNNAATDELAAGDIAQAVAKLERCHAERPDNAVFAGNLAEALVRLARLEHDRGELADAVLHLARAVELGSAREDVETLRRILARWKAELELGEDDWTAESSRFELTFDTDRTDILFHSHEVLEHLEVSYDKLVRWFGTDPLAGPEERAPIRVVLYDPEDFDRLTGLGDWAAGLFDGVVRVSVRDLTAGQEWRSVLVHELVHAFVVAFGGARVPGWLNEGLAQLLEERPGEVARLEPLLAGREPFPLEQLAGSLTTWEDTAAIGRAYAQSLVFVDYLRRTYGQEVLRKMLVELPSGATPEATFQQWTSVALDLAFQDWRALLAR